jgi:hypothetical protein
MQNITSIIDELINDGSLDFVTQSEPHRVDHNKQIDNITNDIHGNVRRVLKVHSEHFPSWDDNEFAKWSTGYTLNDEIYASIHRAVSNHYMRKNNLSSLS